MSTLSNDYAPHNINAALLENTLRNSTRIYVTEHLKEFLIEHSILGLCSEVTLLLAMNEKLCNSGRNFQSFF